MRISSPRAAFTLLEAAVVIAVLAVLASLLVIKVDHTMEDAEQTGMRASLQAVAEAFTGSAASQGYVGDMKYYTAPAFDLTKLQVSNLLDDPGVSYDPVTRRGWRGPYVQNPQLVRNLSTARQGFFPRSSDQRFKNDLTFLQRHFYKDATASPYGTEGAGAVGDQWGNPIVLQIPPDSAISNPTPERLWKYARLVSAGPDGILETPLADRLAGKIAAGTSAVRGDDIVLFLNRADLYDEADAP